MRNRFGKLRAIPLGVFLMPSTEKTEIVEPRREAHLTPPEGAPHSEAHHHVLREAAIARFLAGGRWRLVARWLGLGIFLFGALLLGWVFWQAMTGFQNLLRPNYFSGEFNRAVTMSGDGVLGQAQLQAAVVVFGTEFLRVMYLLLLGFLASVIAGKGIQFFAASEAVIDEAVVGEMN
jgi:hypothetical protein